MRGISLILLLTMLFLFGGCSKGTGLIDVTGTVKIDGTPTEGVNLLFFPTGAGNPSSAMSEAGGVFKITTDLNPGIRAGSYSVTAVYPDPSVKPTESQRMQGIFEPAPDLLKGKYQTKEKGVKVEISSGSKDITVELKK